jgi:hypothetical protein
MAICKEHVGSYHSRPLLFFSHSMLPPQLLSVSSLLALIDYVLCFMNLYMFDLTNIYIYPHKTRFIEILNLLIFFIFYNLVF